MSGFWSDEDKQTIKALWAEGLSATQIARQMPGKRTRNAVLGVVHRMKLSSRISAKGGLRPVRVSRPPQPKPAPVADTPAPAPEDPGPMHPPLTTLTVRDHHCKWPYDVGADYHYCGAKPHKDHPFCEYHCRKAYQPKLAAKRAA